MANNLDLSLDDLIKKNKTTSTSSSSSAFNSKRGARGRGLAGRTGTAAAPARNFPDRSARRPAPYFTPAPNPKYGVYTDQQIASAAAAAAAAAVGRVLSIETGTKLYISNLEYGVSNEDIKELFAEVGEIKRYSINYDRSGRSKGTAEVVYAKKDDALAALRRYNNVQLDGKPMKIEFIGTNVDSQAVPAPTLMPPPAMNPMAMGWNPGFINGMPRSGPGRGIFGNGPGRGGMFNNGARGGNFGGVRGGRGGGRFGRGGATGNFTNGKGQGNNNKNVSAADLDAELDKYHAAAMETN